MKKVLAMAFLVVGLSFAGGGLTSQSAKASCVKGVASWDMLWIRSGPSSKNRKVGAIPHNACRVRVYWNTCRGWWCRVSYRGVTGWSHTRYIR